jgi:hypothetical protein
MSRESEVKMFGCSVDTMREWIGRSITYKVAGRDMFVASILSDAQELIGMGATEQARQLLNRAKWILFETQPEEVQS